MTVQGRDGPVVRIDVTADGAADVASLPRTDRGLGVGSTADEVRAAYPDGLGTCTGGRDGGMPSSRSRQSPRSVAR